MRIHQLSEAEALASLGSTTEGALNRQERPTLRIPSESLDADARGRERELHCPRESRLGAQCFAARID